MPLNCTTDNKIKSYSSGFPFSTHLTLSLCHGFEIILAITLNAMMIYYFVRRRVPRTSFNILLLNLAISDVVTAVGLIPYIAVNSSMLLKAGNEYAGFLCALTEGQLVFWIGTASAMFTLAVIAAGRYMAINHPFHRWTLNSRTRTATCVSVAVVWTLAFINGIPNILTGNFDRCEMRCRRNLTSVSFAVVYAIFTTTAGFLLPLFLMLIGFFGAVYSLWIRERPTINNPVVVRSRRRVLHVLAALILVLIICWMPFCTYWILANVANFFPSGNEGHALRSRVFFVILLPAMFNSVLNPIIYGFKSQEFKKNSVHP